MFFQHTRTSKKIVAVRFAHQLTRRLVAVRQQGIMQDLYPDGKAQVAIAYENHTSIAIAKAGDLDASCAELVAARSALPVDRVRHEAGHP